MTTARTRVSMTPRDVARASRAADDAARIEPKPEPRSRAALSECVRAALRCASSVPFVASAVRSHPQPAEPAPFVCG